MAKKIAVACLMALAVATPAAGKEKFWQAVVINEIAWMGGKSSPKKEWIELYNNFRKEIDLTGWILKSSDNSLKIKLKGKIPGKKFYLLKRESLKGAKKPDKQGILFYQGALNNKGENLLLFDSNNQLIDMVNCSNGWFAGNNKTKQTMERINPLESASQKNWQNSENPGGTPGKENSRRIKNPPSKNKKLPEFILFLSTATAFLSGIIILLLKNILKK